MTDKKRQKIHKLQNIQKQIFPWRNIIMNKLNKSNRSNRSNFIYLELSRARGTHYDWYFRVSPGLVHRNNLKKTISNNNKDIRGGSITEQHVFEIIDNSKKIEEPRIIQKSYSPFSKFDPSNFSEIIV